MLPLNACRCYLFKDCKTRFLDALLAVARVELFMPGVRSVATFVCHVHNSRDQTMPFCNGVRHADYWDMRKAAGNQRPCDDTQPF